MKIYIISFLLLSLSINIPLINSFPIFENIYLEKNIVIEKITKQYCDSLEKNLFKGLDKELTLKYEYFFSSIPDNFIRDKNKVLKNLKTNIKSLCSYELSTADEQEFTYFLENYLKKRNNTPKIKVEAKKPSPTNPAIIPVLR